ncbi:conjugative relaxase domain-containing protein, TrwC/TraI family [Chitinophaga eiseniae]|uniref:Conjugative relaxase domain-containing protein, TrwC/TraI family n=1 Tax=Chitinophaga eiseniae TaxID=634771 RepID=A0A1T4KPT2_9BACT|nr:MobF family relaxase [Chitinophaga eiseniae]SJZ44358.1 conjugative relaxase domain-containing protein, TrwC/TraI family [Chitinophaga eiseniae]
MIRMIQSTSAAHAQAYYTSALSPSDYYTSDQELPGKFAGKLAARLGLTGDVTKEAFFALTENRNPVTGKALTPVTKENRTIGYDINFHASKSVSILYALSKDDHILKAFEQSVFETMQEIEADAQTRVRIGGADTDRKTGELLWAGFTHQTARPVDGSLPDVHLHHHAFCINATFDEVENKVKACQFREIQRDMPYYQARFHKRLADKLQELNYQVRKTDKAFEIDGVPKEIIAHFSKRTNQIGQIAKEKGITDARKLDELGARTRAAKQQGHTMAELKAAWKQEMRALTAELSDDFDKALRFAQVEASRTPEPEQSVRHSIRHHFERVSVFPERRLLATAYHHAIGNSSTTLDHITDHFQKDDQIIRVEDRGRRMVCTTVDVLEEERRMVTLARAGQGQLTPLYRDAPVLNLDGQQAAASYILTTTNRTSIIRGVAGAGKTTLLKELVPCIEKAGKQVTIIAPSADASRGTLRDQGFKDTDTVSLLLSNKDMQAKLADQVLIVDEAGMLGTGQALHLLEVATEQNAQVIFVGDTRQHSAVTRGDALRILNTVGGIQTAEVDKIYRQKNVDYRAAVEFLSQGKARDGFEKLDSIGAIKDCDPLSPHTELAKDYVAALKIGKSALVISPTRQEGEKVTASIRSALREVGLLGKRDHAVSKLSNLNFTEAQRADWRNYKEGQVIQFSQNVPGAKKGSQWSVKTADDKAVTLENTDGKALSLPCDRAQHFAVFQKEELSLAKGDVIRITHNSFDKQDKRLDNATMLEVVSVSDKGDILLRNTASKVSYKLGKEFGHLEHAHCITSHGSQGKTVDRVFIAQNAATFPATDLKQFYVSVSRGREAVTVYTDDKTALLEHASDMGDRQSALELLAAKDLHIEHALQQERATAHLLQQEKNIEKSISPEKHRIDYELEL